MDGFLLLLCFSRSSHTRHNSYQLIILYQHTKKKEFKAQEELMTSMLHFCLHCCLIKEVMAPRILSSPFCQEIFRVKPRDTNALSILDFGLLAIGKALKRPSRKLLEKVGKQIVS